MGYKMVMIRDPDEGCISMLDRNEGEGVRDKIIVRCVYMKKGSVDTSSIVEAQESGEFYHADEVWCITPTDFTDDAIRKSKKPGSKVRLIDGKRMRKETI